MNKFGAAVFIGQSLDGITFSLAVTLFPALIAHEQNVVVAALYGFGGIALVLAAKVGLSGFVALSRPPKGRIAKAFYVFAAASGLLGAAANVYALAQLLAL